MADAPGVVTERLVGLYRQARQTPTFPTADTPLGDLADQLHALLETQAVMADRVRVWTETINRRVRETEHA